MLPTFQPSVVPDQEEPGLLWNVGIPNEEVLREGDVCPEDDEGVHELTHDVEMLFIDELQITELLQEQHRKDRDRHAVQGTPSEHVDSPHGREPSVVERFHEVDGSKANTDRKEEEETTTETTSTLASISRCRPHPDEQKSYATTKRCLLE